MHTDPEPLLHPVHKLARSRRGSLRRDHLLEKVDDLLGKFGTLLGPWATREDARKTLSVEPLVSGIERGPREAESRGRLGNGFSVDADPPQHLVLDLDEILRIEEVLPCEERIADLLWATVQAAVLSKGVSSSTHVKLIMPHVGDNGKPHDTPLGNSGPQTNSPVLPLLDIFPSGRNLLNTTGEISLTV